MVIVLQPIDSSRCGIRTPVACVESERSTRWANLPTGAGTYSADTTKAVPLFQVVLLSM